MVDVSQPPSTAADEARPLPDFSNVEETFRHLSDGELRPLGDAPASGSAE